MYEANAICTRAANALIDSMSVPYLLRCRDLLESSAARRLLREVASVLAQFHGDPPDPPIEDFFRSEDPLVPSGASGILQISCDADHILGRIEQSLDELCTASQLKVQSVVDCALRLLGPIHHQHRTLFAVVLHVVAGRGDLAEDVLRAAAFDLMQLCHVLSFSEDRLAHKRRTMAQASTQFLRRRAARMSWQLETCLWLHRGGGLPLFWIGAKGNHSGSSRGASRCQLEPQPRMSGTNDAK